MGSPGSNPAHRYHGGAAQDRSGVARKIPAEHYGLGLRFPREVDFRPESPTWIVVVFSTTRAKPAGFPISGKLFEESNLPFRVDLFVWDDVPEQFRKRIEAEYVVLVEREEQGFAAYVAVARRYCRRHR